MVGVVGLKHGDECGGGLEMCQVPRLADTLGPSDLEKERAGNVKSIFIVGSKSCIHAVDYDCRRVLYLSASL